MARMREEKAAYNVGYDAPARVGVSRVLIAEPPLVVLPSLAVCVGLNEAIVLQQVHYWLSGRKAHERDGRKWVYNTADEWQEQFPFWSINTVRRALQKLRDDGFLLATDEYNKMKIDRTLWYTIDYDALAIVEVAHPVTQNGQSSNPDWEDGVTQVGQTNNQRLPETTSETTEVISLANGSEKEKSELREKTANDASPLDSVLGEVVRLVEDKSGLPITMMQREALEESLALHGRTKVVAALEQMFIYKKQFNPNYFARVLVDVKVPEVVVPKEPSIIPDYDDEKSPLP